MSDHSGQYTKRPLPADYDPAWLGNEFGNVQRALPIVTTKTVAASHTLTANDDVVLVDATAGPLTITFPDPTRSRHGTWTVKKIDASANPVTFSSVVASTSSSATFDGATSPTLVSRYDVRTMRSDGAAYYQVQNPPAVFSGTISASSITGTITYSTLPVGNGSWDTGAGTTVTITRSLTVSGTLTGTLTGHASLDLPLTGGTLTGNLLFTDATYDIGQSGATRPRNGYFSGTLTIGGAATFSSTVAASQFLSLILDSNAASDLLLKRNGVTQLTLSSSLGTFVGAIAATTVALTKATAGDVATLTNGAGTPQTAYINSGNAYCGFFNGAGLTGQGIALTSNSAELWAAGARTAWVTSATFSVDSTKLAVFTRFGEDTLTWGNSAGGVQEGALAQVDGAALGFDIMTPANSTTPYYLIISGKDSADGGSPSNAFIDNVAFQSQGTLAPKVIASTDTIGAPGARTYSNDGGKLKIAIASGTTWYIDTKVMRFGH